jgi:hypothetical protein
LNNKIKIVYSQITEFKSLLLLSLSADIKFFNVERFFGAVKGFIILEISLEVGELYCG